MKGLRFGASGFGACVLDPRTILSGVKMGVSGDKGTLI